MVIFSLVCASIVMVQLVCSSIVMVSDLNQEARKRSSRISGE